MEKKFFFMKLVAPRPTFPYDMTDAEKSIMQQHTAYLKGYLDKGMIKVYGPVFDPNGAFGMGVVEAANEEEVQAMIAQDPATQISRYEVYPMIAVLPQ